MPMLKLTTAPSGDVVTLPEVKAQLRIDGSEEDLLLKTYIATSTDRAERITGRKFLTQTWTWYMDSFPYLSDWIRVPLAPLISVDSIKYYDKTNALQTLSTSAYDIDVGGSVPRITTVYNQWWPETYVRLGAVQIQFQVGYGTSTSVPTAIKHWIMAAVAESYKNREFSVDRNVETLSSFMVGLLDPYIVPGFG